MSHTKQGWINENGQRYMYSSFNGKLYRIPQEKMDELLKYIKEVWGAGLDQVYPRVPTNTRGLSFTLFLREWYDEHFKEYEVGG